MKSSGAVVELLTAEPIAAGQGVQLDQSGRVQVASSLRTRPMVGVALEGSSQAGDTIRVLAYGALDPSMVNLQAGKACAVGVDVNGNLARATAKFPAPACASALNWVGWCDESGQVFVQPTQEREFNVRSYGAVPDWDPQKGAGTPNIEAFEAALAAITASGHRHAKLIADGHFYLEGTLHVRQSIVFEGTGRSEPTVGGTRSSPGTWLVFPRDVDGIQLHTGLEEEGGADFTTLRNLTVWCKHLRRTQPAPPDPGQIGQGIWINCPAYLDHVTVENFGGHGVLVDAGHGGHPGNAGGFQLTKCIVGNCGGDGIHIRGGDATVGLVSCCSSVVNFGWEFLDETPAGNTFVACHGEGNQGYGDGTLERSYKTHSVGNSSIFLGCYSEGPAANELEGASMAIGGSLSLEHLNVGSPFLLAPGGVASRQALTHVNRLGPEEVEIEFGQRDGNGGVLNFVLPGRDYSLLHWDSTTGWWGIDNSSPNGRTSIRLPATISRPRRTAPLFSNGIFYGTANVLGAGASAAMTNHIAGTEIPTSGTWEKGDIVWNSTPDPLAQDDRRFIGWVCTEQGTNGTLNAGRAHGSIAAGSTELTVGDEEGLEKWQYSTIAGVPGVYQIISDVISEPIDPNDPDGPNVHKVQIDQKTAVAAGLGAAITFAKAMFKTFGPINP